MFGLSPIRLYAYLAVFLVIAGILAHDKYLGNRLKARTAQVSDLTSELVNERENTRKEHESAQRYAARLAISRGPRSPPTVLLCKLPAAKPASAAAAGTDAAPAPDDGRVPEDVDIGPRLDVSFHACEENLIKLEELQRWVRGR